MEEPPVFFLKGNVADARVLGSIGTSRQGGESLRDLANSFGESGTLSRPHNSRGAWIFFAISSLPDESRG
jgi:hypothetical protein